MFSALSPGAVSITTKSLADAAQAARIGGFEGVELNIEQIADRLDSTTAENLLAELDGIRPAAFGLPTDWRGDEAMWRFGLEALPRLAKAAQSLGLTRTATWVLSGSDQRIWDANWDFHVQRFQPIASILNDHGISLGLEFLGPKTLRDSFRFPFAHTIGTMFALAQEIGPNVGLLLDSWHWHTSHGTLEDIRYLKAKDIVVVHVNDAPAEPDIDQLVDNVRCLPGETGVIDIKGFIDTLRFLRYDGPVIPEPFKRELSDLPDDRSRLEVVGQSMRKILTP
jgi:sugar phosphate isomerase/epimerase